MDRFKETIEGVRDSLPVCLGYLPLGFAFGVLGKAAGLSILETALMSAMNFTGAGQYIAIGLLTAGASSMTIILANLLVNQRYFLFSTSLVPYLKPLPIRKAAALMLGLTDEVYAVTVVHSSKREATIPYMAGLTITSYLSWVGSSLLGAFFGAMISDTRRFGLDFALPAMYAILLVLVIRNRRDLLVALISVAICLVMAYAAPTTMKNLSNILVAAIVAASVGVVIKK